MASSTFARCVAAAALFGLSACAGDAPPSVGMVEVVFHTDPITGRTDGPFDPQTGMRTLTQIGADGVMRVVVDSVSLTPVLIHEQRAPTAQPVLSAPRRVPSVR